MVEACNGALTFVCCWLAWWRHATAHSHVCRACVPAQTQSRGPVRGWVLTKVPDCLMYVPQLWYQHHPFTRAHAMQHRAKAAAPMLYECPTTCLCTHHVSQTPPPPRLPWCVYPFFVTSDVPKACNARTGGGGEYGPGCGSCSQPELHHARVPRPCQLQCVQWARGRGPGPCM